MFHTGIWEVLWRVLFLLLDNEVAVIVLGLEQLNFSIFLIIGRSGLFEVYLKINTVTQ